MNDFLLALILGVVEGVTEFLPVSSTAHIRLVQHYLGVSLSDEFWKLFAVFIQLGAILAVMVLYRQRLRAFCGSKAPLLRHPFLLIAIAFLCTAIPAFLLKKVIGQNLESLTVMGSALLVGGVVMIAVDYFFQAGKVQSVESMRLWQAVVIGSLQVLSAVFPGTSRSMSTIAAGQVVGMTRSAALDFSFLVSIPVMIVATLYDLLKYSKSEPTPLSVDQLLCLGIGFVVSFVVAYIVVAWFLSYVRTRGFLFFGLYRIGLGVFLLQASFFSPL